MSLSPSCSRTLNGSVDVLSDADLLAVVLGTGRSVGVLAAVLLDGHGGLGGLARAGLGSLTSTRGVGAVKAARLAAALELGRRAAEESVRDRLEQLPHASAVYAWARSRLVPLEHEELWVLALDGQNGLRAARRAALGGLHGMHVAVRDPIRIALREAASVFVLVHNHPSGDPTPSREDIAFTQQVDRLAHQLGTPLVDHVVVGRGGYASMMELGMFRELGVEEASQTRRTRGLRTKMCTQPGKRERV
ncbi:MAG: JAB domain-containing protein [Myxococcales bacterium]